MVKEVGSDYRLSRMPSTMKNAYLWLKREVTSGEIPWSVRIPSAFAAEAAGNFQEMVEGKADLIVAISNPGSKIFESMLEGYVVKHPQIELSATAKIEMGITGELEDRFLKDPNLNPEGIFFVNDAGVMSELNYQGLLRCYQEWLGTDEVAKELTRKTAQKISEKDLNGPLKVLMVNDADFTGGMEITAREITRRALATLDLTVKSIEMVNFLGNHPVSLPGTGWIGSVQGEGVLGETFETVLRAKQLAPSNQELWAINSLFVAMIEQGVENEGEIRALGEQISQKGKTINPAESLDKIVGRDRLVNFLSELYQAFEEIGREIGEMGKGQQPSSV